MSTVRMDTTIKSNELKSILNFACWNIRGFNSKVLGNKLVSQDFLKEIANNNIVGLVETHIHSNILNDLAIPGYSLLNYTNQDYNAKSKTAPGGLAVFCKDHLSEHIIPIKSTNKDCIWINIKKDLHA